MYAPSRATYSGVYCPVSMTIPGNPFAAEKKHGFVGKFGRDARNPGWGRVLGSFACILEGTVNIARKYHVSPGMFYKSNISGLNDILIIFPRWYKREPLRDTRRINNSFIFAFKRILFEFTFNVPLLFVGSLPMFLIYNCLISRVNTFKTILEK